MKRRRRPMDSSLELLLDTICNTFGGVLFLAILVTVLLRNSSKSQVTAGTHPPADPVEIAKLSEKFTKLDAHASGLRRALKSQESLAAQFIQPDKKKQLQILHDLREQYELANGERRSLLDEIAERQARTAEVAAKLSELDAELAKQAIAVETAEKTVKSELASKTKSAQLPRLRTTRKQEIGIVVRFGRFYIWHRYDEFGQRLGLNTADFVIVNEEDGVIVTKPKPYAGIALKEPKLQSSLTTVLKRFKCDRQCLCLCVWPDSFDKFQILKTALVEMGYEYRLMVMSEGKSAVDRGGRGGRVQ